LKYLKTNTGIFIILFLISFVIKLTLILFFRFDGFYGQDSYAYYDNSKVFIESLYMLKIPPNFYWPIGFYVLTLLFNFITSGNIAAASLFVSVTAGSLLPGITYLLSSELIKDYYESVKAKKISILAGLIICFSGVIIKSGMVVMSDMPGLIFSVLSVYYFSRYLSENIKNNLYLMGVFLSLSILTRYANIFFLFLFIVIYLYHRYKNKSNFNLKHCAVALIIALLVFSPQLFYIMKHGISYFRPETGPGVWPTLWNPLNYFTNNFATTDGVMNYRFWNIIYYSSLIFHPLYLSIFGFAFISGTYFAIKRKYKHLILFSFPWILIFILILSGFPNQSGRYALGFFPPLAIIASVGIAEINLKYFYKNIFVLLGLFLLIIYAVFHINNFVSEKNNDLFTIEYLTKNIHPGSMLLTFEITGAVNHYSDINHRDIYYYNEQGIKDLFDSVKTNIYIIIPETKIQTQWKGLPLEDTYSYIKNNYILIKQSDINYYSIYSIKRK